LNDGTHVVLNVVEVLWIFNTPKKSTPLSGPAGVRQNHFFGQPKCLQGYANAGS
jgi:hypothetical protein